MTNSSKDRLVEFELPKVTAYKNFSLAGVNTNLRYGDVRTPKITYVPPSYQEVPSYQESNFNKER